MNIKLAKLNDTLRANWVLLIILAVAGIVRYWGITFGLPNNLSRPDEQTVTTVTVRFFTGDLNPHHFHYGSFYYYLLFVFYGGYYMLGLLSGKYDSVSDLFWEFRLDPTNFHLISRGLSAFLGTATVIVTYKIAERFFDRKTAVISSLFIGLTLLHVRDSHFGVTDVANCFWIALSILYIIKSYQDKRWESYLLAGIMAGLSTSTKYVGVILLLPMGIVHLFNLLDEKNLKNHTVGSRQSAVNSQEKKAIRNPQSATCFPIKELFLDKRILSFVIAMFIAFMVTTPYALLDYTNFISDFLLKMKEAGAGHHVTLDNGTKHYILLGRGWWYHLRYSFFFGLGWSLLFASLAGILILIKENKKKAAIFCSFPLVYYAFSGKGYTVFLRYTIPLIPFLCITGALATVFIGERLADFLRLSHRNAITSLLAILIILPSTYNVARLDELLAKKDNRLIAAEWIEKNIPEGSSIYQPGLFWGKIWLHPNFVSLIRNAYNQGDEEKKKELKFPYDYVMTHSIKGYNQWGYDDRIKRFIFNNQTINDFPEYIIARKSPLREYDMFSSTIGKLLKASYHLVKSFEVININNKDNWFDRQDAFYLPFAGFKEVRRPGPNIYIYERNP